MKPTNLFSVYGFCTLLFFSLTLLSVEGSVAQDTVKIMARPVPRQSPVRAQRPPVIRQSNGPDVRITNVTGVPTAITTLDLNGECPYFFADVTIKNVGNEDAWFPLNTWIIGGESQYTNISAPGQITNAPTTSRMAIRPNETFSAKLAGKAKCLNSSSVTISFDVDPQNVVAESNETNNTWIISVPNRAVPNLSQKPDLVVNDVWFTPENPDYYSRVMINLEMRNIASGSAVFCQGNTIWMAYIEGQNGGSGGAGNRVIVSNETMRGGIYISDSGELTNGCYRVLVKVDPQNAIDESNENNNTTTAYLSIGGVSCQSKMDEDNSRGWTLVKKLHEVPLKRINTDPMIRLSGQ